MRLVRTLGLLAVVAAAGATSATAQLYSSRSAWLAAVIGSPTTVNFNGFAPDPNTCQGNCAVGPFTILGATFGSSQIPFIVDNNNDGDSIYDWGTGAVFSPQPFDLTQPNIMSVSLPGGFYALAFDYGQNLVGDGTTSQITLSNGSSYALPATSVWPTLAFFGVVSNTPFNGFTIDILDGSFAPIFDNVSWGTAAATSVTPEPATMSLLATGLVGMVGAGARRRKRN